MKTSHTVEVLGLDGSVWYSSTQSDKDIAARHIGFQINAKNKAYENDNEIVFSDLEELIQWFTVLQCAVTHTVRYDPDESR